MAISDTTNENSKLNEWQVVVQQITTSGTTSDKEWKWKRESVLGMILAFIMKQKVNLIPENFYLFWY